MKILLCIASLVVFPWIGLCGVLDATNLETLASSLKEAQKGESAEAVALTNKIVCESAHGLDLKKPEDRVAVLERLRTRLHGKTIQAVVLEVKMQQASESAEKKRKAEELVRERRQLWRGRAMNIPSIVPGVTRDQVLKLLGEPDRKSGSPPNESWLYRYDAAHNEEQIWIDSKAIELTDGTVSKVTLLPTRRAIEDVEPLKQPTAGESTSSPENSPASGK